MIKIDTPDFLMLSFVSCDDWMNGYIGSLILSLICLGFACKRVMGAILGGLGLGRVVSWIGLGFGRFDCVFVREGREGEGEREREPAAHYLHSPPGASRGPLTFAHHSRLDAITKLYHPSQTSLSPLGGSGCLPISTIFSDSPAA